MYRLDFQITYEDDELAELYVLASLITADNDYDYGYDYDYSNNFGLDGELNQLQVINPRIFFKLSDSDELLSCDLQVNLKYQESIDDSSGVETDSWIASYDAK